MATFPIQGYEITKENGHFSGLRVRAESTPSNKVYVNPGYIGAGKSIVEFAGGTIQVESGTTAVYIVYISTAGSLGIVEGTPASSTLPSWTDNKIPLAAVNVTSGTSITNDMINDVRPFLWLNESFDHSLLSTGNDDHAISNITGLQTALDAKASTASMNSALDALSGVDGASFTLNEDVTGTPSEDCSWTVERGTATNATITWDESADAWGFVCGNATASTTLVLNHQLSGTDTPIDAIISVNRGSASATAITWDELFASYDTPAPAWVVDQDVVIDDATKGFVVKDSTDGFYYRILTSGGTLSTSALSS